VKNVCGICSVDPLVRKKGILYTVVATQVSDLRISSLNLQGQEFFVGQISEEYVGRVLQFNDLQGNHIHLPNPTAQVLSLVGRLTPSKQQQPNDYKCHNSKPKNHFEPRCHFLTPSLEGGGCASPEWSGYSGMSLHWDLLRRVPVPKGRPRPCAVLSRSSGSTFGALNLPR
jgi:hypothetical protein